MRGRRGGWTWEAWKEGDVSLSIMRAGLIDFNGISARLTSMVGKAFEAFWLRQIGFLLKMRLSVHEMDRKGHACCSGNG